VKAKHQNVRSKNYGKALNHSKHTQMYWRVRKAVPRKKGIDITDIKILKRLLRNSRTSFAEIAEECKVSTLTIKKRYDRLKKAGIIKGSLAIVNQSSAFGIEAIVDSLVTVNPQRVNQFIRDIQDLFQDRSSLTCLPIKFNENYNVSVSALVRSIDKIQEIREKLKQHPDVVHIETNIWTYIKIIPQNLDLQPLV
jgi:DNA-binding Lrp family transcriptional regulator